jgi:predicted translin family RNA/ssDNA-binding protein
MINGNSSLLDLEPINNEGRSAAKGLSLVLPEKEQTKNEIIQISDDNIVFQANMDAASYRSCASIKTASEIFQFASEANKEVTSTLTTMVEETKDSSCGQYVQEFNSYLAKMASQNTIELLKIGTGKIVYELTKPALPPLVYKRPKGLLAKLLLK